MFYRFTYLCRIGSREIRGFPRDILNKKYKYHLHDVVYMVITFISCYDRMKYHFYMKQPRQMIETKLIQMLDKNPKILHQFPHMPEPIIRRITFKYWGQKFIDDANREAVAIYVNYRGKIPMKPP